MSGDWFRLRDSSNADSPSLLVFPERIEANLARMLQIAGGVHRLRPHLKTHKVPELIRLQLGLGINKFKCATVAEAEMAAVAGAEDLLLACQPVGSAANRLATLAQNHPHVQFSAVIDDLGAAQHLSDTARAAGVNIGFFVDLDIGQHRTGIDPDAGAEELVKKVIELPNLPFLGLHAYDGHLGITDFEERRRQCNRAFEPVLALENRLIKQGIAVGTIVAGGSPTFAIHAERSGVELSPGTTVFWDAGYTQKLPEMPFKPAAILLTRVMSKPGKNQLCLDLGHKAVASEMPQPRAVFPEIRDAVALSHSDEHLVIETSHASEFPVGTAVYALPWHICPTVALHQNLFVVVDGAIRAEWQVTARARRISV